MRLRRALLLCTAGLTLLWTNPAGAQGEVEPGHAAIPFDKWYAAGEREQIPWTIRLREQWMRADLRLAASFTVTVAARELNRRGANHELFLLARVCDPAGNWMKSHGLLSHKIEQPLPPATEVSFTVNFLVRPGNYHLVLILYDRVTGEHSLAKRPLRIAPLANDPLPEAFRDLPGVEFTPPAEGLDRFLEPQMTSRLWLPVLANQPLRVEVLINFGAGEPRLTPRDSNRRLWILARTLRLLAQLQVEGNALRLTGVDGAARRMLFQVDDARSISWEDVRDTLAGTAAAGTISVGALEGRSRNAWFFKETVLQLLTGRIQLGNDTDAAGAKRILIIASTPVEFAKLESGIRLPRAEDCNCRVYYFCYRFVDRMAADELGSLLGPLRPRRFDLYRPEDVRKALGVVLKEASQP